MFDFHFERYRVCIPSVKFVVVVVEEILEFVVDGPFGDVLAKIMRPQIVGAKTPYGTQIDVVLKVNPYYGGRLGEKRGASEDVTASDEKDNALVALLEVRLVGIEANSFVDGIHKRGHVERQRAEIAPSVRSLAMFLVNVDAHLAAINGDGDMVGVGVYFDSLEAASAHESSAKRNLGANACSRKSSDHDDSNAGRHVGRRSSGGIGWR